MILRLAMAFVATIAASTTHAGIIGDSIGVALTRQPGNASFTPFSETIAVVNGVDIQRQVFSLGESRIDAVVDLSDTKLDFSLVRTDPNPPSSDFGGGSASVLTLALTDLDWMTPVTVQFAGSSTTNNSVWT